MGYPISTIVLKPEIHSYKDIDCLIDCLQTKWTKNEPNIFVMTSKISVIAHFSHHWTFLARIFDHIILIICMIDELSFSLKKWGVQHLLHFSRVFPVRCRISTYGSLEPKISWHRSSLWLENRHAPWSHFCAKNYGTTLEKWRM